MSEVIFRVQDCEGRGPWRPGFSHRWVECRPDHDNLLPYFSEFGRIYLLHNPEMHFGCGCKTMGQLRRWFTKAEYNKLRKFGYKAVRMEVDNVLAESNIQCVFERAVPLNKNLNVVKLY